METSSSSLLLSSSGNKRARDAEAEEAEGKRLRPEDLLDMLDDVADADTAAGDDLASVMRSLQEEISADLDVSLPQPELGFLLEASDDELGLPPAAGSSSSSDDGASGAAWEDQHAFGAQIWGFEDEIQGYGYVSSSPEAAAAAAAAAAEWGDDGFDAGLFAFGDDGFGASDLDAMRHHHETMPAV